MFTIEVIMEILFLDVVGMRIIVSSAVFIFIYDLDLTGLDLRP